MSEASLLCLQNDLLCCVKEGKELFRCHENKGLDWTIFGYSHSAQ